jgi:hypothetical protein
MMGAGRTNPRLPLAGVSVDHLNCLLDLIAIGLSILNSLAGDPAADLVIHVRPAFFGGMVVAKGVAGRARGGEADAGTKREA